MSMIGSWLPPSDLESILSAHHDRIGRRLDRIETLLEKIMTAESDLTGAVANLGTEITTFLSDIASQISGGVTAEQAAAVVEQINGFTSQLQAADPANPPAAPAAPAQPAGS